MCLGYIRHVCTAQWSSLQQTAGFIRAVYVRLVFTETVHCQTMLKSWLEQDRESQYYCLCALFTVCSIDMPFFVLNDGESSASHNKAEVDFKLYSVSVESREIKRIFMLSGGVRATWFVVTE